MKFVQARLASTRNCIAHDAMNSSGTYACQGRTDQQTVCVLATTSFVGRLLSLVDGIESNVITLTLSGIHRGIIRFAMHNIKGASGLGVMHETHTRVSVVGCASQCLSKA
eukprot:m.1591192 g.1591192  ORF g.1591192 m.1591192 type:complete len:110 (-) comp25337_c0_seq17:5313-5642(-)